MHCSKAFDAVNYNILLRKFYNYGIRGVALKWFTGYLADRKQAVLYRDVMLRNCNIPCGVPQGSVLGPLLFLLYVNDIANASTVPYQILFVDDINTFINGRNVESLVLDMLNIELSKLATWLHVNKPFISSAK